MTTELPTTCGAAVRSSDWLCHKLETECGAKIGADVFWQLEPNEQQILYLRFVEGLTLKETGIIVRNLKNPNAPNAERVRQLQNSAIRKLRRIMWHNDLDQR